MASLSPSLGIPPIRSFDGYIRITFDTFLTLNFSKRLAWKDGDLYAELIREGFPANSAGYCEWSTDNALSPVSLGWAWFCIADGRIFLAPGGISSNLMFIMPSSDDMKARNTERLLCAWLTGEDWQPRGIASNP